MLDIDIEFLREVSLRDEVPVPGHLLRRLLDADQEARELKRRVEELEEELGQCEGVLDDVRRAAGV